MYQTASPYISVDRVPVPMLHSTESAADEKCKENRKVWKKSILGNSPNGLWQFFGEYKPRLTEVGTYWMSDN